MKSVLFVSLLMITLLGCTATDRPQDYLNTMTGNEMGASAGVEADASAGVEAGTPAGVEVGAPGGVEAGTPAGVEAGANTGGTHSETCVSSDSCLCGENLDGTCCSGFMMCSDGVTCEPQQEVMLYSVTANAFLTRDLAAIESGTLGFSSQGAPLERSAYSARSNR